MSKSSSSVKRTALMVLGMHRSGTSALSGVLAKLGAEVPKTLMPPTADNPKGYWESSAVMDFNNAVLESADSRWDEWEAFNREWPRTESGKSIISELPALLIREFGDAPLFLIKDPRICRLLPLWLPLLSGMNVTAKIVVPVRNPIEVAQSLEARNKITRLQALSIWLRHMLDAEYASREHHRVFVRYSDLLADWRSETSRIAKVLEIEWPRRSGRTEAEIDDYLDSALKHHTAEQKLPSGTPIMAWTSQTYAAYCDLADGRNEKGAQDRLDAVKEAFDASAEVFAPLFHEVRRDLKKRLDAKIADVTRFAVEVKDLSMENASLKQERAVEEGAVMKYKTDLDTVKEQLRGYENTFGAMDAKHRSICAELGATKVELASVYALQKQVAALQRDWTESRQRRDDMSDKLAVAESRIRDASAERERMEETHRQQIGSLSERLDARAKDAEEAKRVAEQEAAERLSDTVILSKRVIELENAASAMDSLRTELDRCRAVQGKQDASLAAHARKAEDQEKRVLGFVAELHLQSAVISEYRRALESIRGASRWVRPSELRLKAGNAIQVRGADGPASENEALLRKSKLFDADWYLRNYPDVRARKMDPVRHYLQYGAKEGRNPGPVFDTAAYNASNPDVAMMCINPLLHYLVYGRKEGRRIVTVDESTARKA